MIAYLSHRFPKYTETFTYDEVAGLAAAGLPVRIYSFRAGDELDWPVEGFELRRLPRRPGPYLAALGRCALRSPGGVVLALRWTLLGRFPRRPTWRERLTALASLPRGAWLALEPGIELYHAQFANETATTALVAALLSGRRFSFRSHTAPNPQLLPTKLARAAIVLAISEHDRELLVAAGPGANVVVSRLGVRIPPGPGAREPGLIASVGSLMEKKGHHVLLESCGILAAAGIEFRCEIAGEGWMQADLERRIAELGLTGRVRLRGRLSRAEIYELLGRASLVVLASVRSEQEGDDGIPVVLMEALACGSPVVATAVSGIPEIVVDGETGLLVEPDDAEALAAAVRRLLETPELADALAEQGRRTVASDYDAATAYERAARLLAAVSEAQPPRGGPAGP